MKRDLAEKITTEYLKPIYSFALKRCANLQDAEDLTQEVVLRAFRALLVKNDLDSPEKFIWTVARNALANYYRDKTRTAIGVPMDDLAEILPSDDDTAGIVEKESIGRLHCEIAYLSKLQRRIVIANELCIPLGTVKILFMPFGKRTKPSMKLPTALVFRQYMWKVKRNILLNTDFLLRIKENIAIF